MTCKCGHSFAEHCGPSRAVECSVVGCACQGFDETPFDPGARRVVHGGTTVTCEACGLKQTFKPRELGTLWLWVESWDGDSSEPEHGAALCSPACVVRLFNDPAKVGTLADAFTISGEKGSSRS